MNKPHDKKFIIILGILVACLLISWNLYFKVYRQEDTVSIHEFPRTIGEWTSEEIEISEREYEILETRNAFVRKYRNEQGEEVDLFIVYSENNRKVSHPPEICYIGGGVSVLNNVKETIALAGKNDTLTVNCLELSLRGERYLSFYWFKVADSFTSNYWKQQILIAIKTLFGSSPSSALLRVSGNTFTGEPDESKRVLKDFVKIIIPQIRIYLP